MVGHGGVRRLRGIEAAVPGRAQMECDWVQGFAVPLAQNDVRSSEQLARAMFEDAPAPVRQLLVAGWRLVLGLRLLSGTSSRSVVGWTVTGATHDEVVLEARSRLLTAVKVLRRTGPDLVATTSVRYETRSGRVVWGIVVPFHLLIEPYLLGRLS